MIAATGGRHLNRLHDDGLDRQTILDHRHGRENRQASLMIAAINPGQDTASWALRAQDRDTAWLVLCGAWTFRPTCGVRDSFRVVAVLASLSFVVAVVLMASATGSRLRIRAFAINRP